MINIVHQQIHTDRQALEAFLLDNPELFQLEEMLDEFNIFEAVGVERQEMRHSDFLAFLLNPQERHGLGSAFVQRFLLAAVQAAEQDTAVSALDLALWDGGGLEVRREWQNIDILLLDEHEKLAVIIENKVDSGEHSQQLDRYWRIVQQRFPGWRTIALFLTPDGREPSSDCYLPVDYGLIRALVTELANSYTSTISIEVQTVLRHYAQMLRRHIMPDSDIAQLCQRIYRKHRRALDLIYEHRPDLQAEMRDFLEAMIARTPGMIAEYSTKTWIRCLPEAWDAPRLSQGQGWVPSNRMLLLEFGNGSDRLHLKVTIGPGPQNVREQLLKLVLDHRPLFIISERRANASVRNRHKAIYVNDFLRAKDFEDADLDELTARVQQSWDQFVQVTLPEMTAVLQKAHWLWNEQKGTC
jgi:hypothetical protein